MLEIVYDALPIEEIHRRREEIPVEGLGEFQILRSTRNIRDSDDFFERYDLYGRDDGDNVDMAGQDGGKEAPDHDERPYCSGYEALLLFLIV